MIERTNNMSGSTQPGPFISHPTCLFSNCTGEGMAVALVIGLLPLFRPMIGNVLMTLKSMEGI
jgi:hypothetical protein